MPVKTKGILTALAFLLMTAQPNLNAGQLEKATFAGGCFWYMEPPFEDLKGVTDVVSGYIGGTGKNPTYEDYAKKSILKPLR